MNQMADSFSQNGTGLEQRLGLLVQRLSVEVARQRMMQGEGRRETFGGLLMQDDEIADMCAQMPGEGIAALATAKAVLAGAEARRCDPGTPSPMARMVALFDLDAVEEALLLLALAPAVDPRFGRVYGYLQEDMAQQYLTPGLAQRLVPCSGLDALRDVLGPDGRLLRHGLLQLTGPVWVTARLDMTDPVVGLLLGAVEVPPNVTVLPVAGPPCRADRPRLLVSGPQADALILSGLSGPQWISRGQPLSQARAAGIAAAMAGAGVVFCGWDAAPLADRQALSVSLGTHATILTEQPDRWGGLGVSFDLVAPGPCTLDQRAAFWTEIAPGLAPALARSRLPLDQLFRLALEAAADADPVTALDATLARHNAAPLRGLADPVRCADGLDDLILPDTAKARLYAFAGRRGSAALVLESWGLGAAMAGRAGGIALFTGPSGVGKTMAAGVVARLAGLDLMRINLATVVSKYIGETEANLERIFTAAAQGEVILFFDEAEALFSKRADVKDARDRYANLEMSYLLQRLEGFHGLAVLASNMGATLDPALLRRFDLVLEFALPDAPARRLIWGKLRRTAVPLARDVDLDALADRFDLAGGHIRQAILSAAHAAAQAGSPVSQELLVQGVAREYAKLGRTLRREDFGDAFARVRGC